MARYRVTGPGGQEYEITAPDDASQDEVLSYARSQFERPQFAPVEQFGGRQPETQAQLAARARELFPDVNPTEGIGGIELITAGIGAGVSRLGRGLRQVGTQALGAMAPAALQPAFAREVQAQQQQESEIRRLEEPLMRTGGGFIGEVVGQATPFLAGGALLRGTEAAGLAMPSTIRGAAAQGAAFGAAQPIAEGESRLGSAAFGGLAGGAGGAITRGIASRLRRAPRIEGEAARVLEESASDPSAVRAALSGSSPETIPGVRPTTAELTGDVGLSGLERGTAVKSREFARELVDQRLENNAARVRAIQEMFEGAAPETAKRLREEAAGIAEEMLPDIKAARGVETMRVVRSLDRMAKSPEFINFPEAEKVIAAARQRLVEKVADPDRVQAARDVIQTSLSARGMDQQQRRILENARRIIIEGQRAGTSADEIAGVIQQVRGLLPKGQTAISDALTALRTTERGKPDVASLYNYRKFFTSEVMPNLSGQSMRAARAFLNDLDSEIVKVAPSYKQYLTSFAQQARRADQAEVGAELLRRGASAARDPLGNPTLLPTQFARAASRPDELVQGATGFRRATAQRVLTPQQREVMEGVRSGLERQASAQRLGVATTGSPTAENLVAALNIGGRISPRIPGVATAQDVLAAIRQRHAERVFRVVQEAMKNPSRAKEILAKLPSEERLRVAQTIQQIGGPAGAVAGVSAISPPSEQE